VGAKRLRRWALILVGGAVIGVGLVALQEATTDPTPVLGSIVPGPEIDTPTEGVVASVTDGDTLRLRGGRRVRLLQIDAPEHDECYGRSAANALRRLAPVGATIALSRDPSLDERDDYGRLLRYAVAPPHSFINVELVREGAAVPYFFRGRRGGAAGYLLDAARDARRNRRGLWGACPGARLYPNRGSLTGPA
jgi:micrococcal nuclease